MHNDWQQTREVDVSCSEKTPLIDAVSRRQRRTGQAHLKLHVAGCSGGFGAKFHDFFVLVAHAAFVQLTDFDCVQ